MKESYKEELANHFGFEPYAVDGNIGGVASARGSVGQLLSSTPFPATGLHFRVPILSCQGEGNIVTTAIGKVDDGRGGVSVVAVGTGSVCTDWCKSIFHVLASSIPILTNDFTPDSR